MSSRTPSRNLETQPLNPNPTVLKATGLILILLTMVKNFVFNISPSVAPGEGAAAVPLGRGGARRPPWSEEMPSDGIPVMPWVCRCGTYKTVTAKSWY